MARVRRVSAGGILWRRSAGGIEVALIRDPETRKWSLPKGRPRAHESLRRAAIREVREETGLKFECGAPLGSVITREPDGSLRVAAYWWMAFSGGQFSPNPEADELRWMAPADGAAILDSPRDQAALELVASEEVLELPA